MKSLGRHRRWFVSFVAPGHDSPPAVCGDASDRGSVVRGNRAPVS
ncbi:hypothetical protein B005_3266 [Nocardiopsis alba ATCC BAA-2165]|uniref:Uncharacterized protein n=1 Tax=Nocardiopsis alba (strain ATCC BAA-2165 / BE74) TaxID=1205910 RepID=J7LD12_NOCAA|nr:hypothetical protein B005_3266 [Nocardiopsis alba ATCC BAA-2165]